MESLCIRSLYIKIAISNLYLIKLYLFQKRYKFFENLAAQCLIVNVKVESSN